MTDTPKARIEALVRSQIGPIICRDLPTIEDDTRWDDPRIDFDSLDRLELVMLVEEEFGIDIPDSDVDNPANETFGGLIRYVEARLVTVDA